MNRGHIQKIFFSLFIFGNIIYSSLVFSQQSDSIPQKTNSKIIPESFKVSGYVDTYYAYYTDSVGTNNYEKISVISPKSNQFSLNVIQLTAQYTAENVRAVATLHYGDIPSSAWSPDFNMIQEANAGFRISNKFWLDAGFFKTHIGTEALLPKDNIVSSLAVITFYEPWWQSGVKLSYLPNNRAQGELESYFFLAGGHCLRHYPGFDRER